MPASIQVACPQCRTLLEVDGCYVGREVQCSECKKVFVTTAVPPESENQQEPPVRAQAVDSAPPGRMTYCRNCGAVVAPQAFACMGCGRTPTNGVKFCQNCGATTPDPEAVVCLRCGAATSRVSSRQVGYASLGPWPPNVLTTCLLISAIVNFVMGGIYILSFFGVIIGIPMIVLGIFELRLRSQAMQSPPGEVLPKVQLFAILEIIAGVLNLGSLPCGILLLVFLPRMNREAGMT